MSFPWPFYILLVISIFSSLSPCSSRVGLAAPVAQPPRPHVTRSPTLLSALRPSVRSMFSPIS